MSKLTNRVSCNDVAGQQLVSTLRYFTLPYIFTSTYIFTIYSENVEICILLSLFCITFSFLPSKHLFTKLIIKTLEKSVKYVQSYYWCCSGVFTVTGLPTFVKKKWVNASKCRPPWLGDKENFWILHPLRQPLQWFWACF